VGFRPGHACSGEGRGRRVGRAQRGGGNLRLELGAHHLGRFVRLTERRRWLAASAALLLPLPGRAAGRPELARRALELRDEALRAGDQPYGAVVAKADRIVGEAPSRVITARDPTAHAEMEAIRDAARKLGTRDLSGCDLYGSSRACKMCEAAAYWAGIARLFHGADAAGGAPPQL
jgi:hypothetical protein